MKAKKRRTGRLGDLAGPTGEEVETQPPVHIDGPEVSAPAGYRRTYSQPAPPNEVADRLDGAT